MMPNISLRQVTDSDLPIFYEQQRDPAAVHMAAFTAANPEDRAAFNDHWARILADDNNLIRTIVVEGQVAGSVSSYVDELGPEVTYWLGRDFWGRGVATVALAAFLKEQRTRPLFARAAADNAASLRVLQKCGFVITGQEQGYANARQQVIDEYVLELGETTDYTDLRKKNG